MKKMVFFFTIAIVVLSLGLSGCFFVQGDYVTGDQIRSAAVSRGIAIEGKNADEIFRELCKKETTPTTTASTPEPLHYYGCFLDDRDWKNINLWLRQEPSTIKTIEQYDNYMKQLKGKKVTISEE